jgi:hypothetical protein
MTRETRTTIDVSDIVAIEFECSKCHSQTIRYLGNWHKTPIGCGSCDEQWMLPHSNDFKNLELFVSMICGITGKAMPFRLRLEIKADGTEKSKA